MGSPVITIVYEIQKLTNRKKVRDASSHRWPMCSIGKLLYRSASQVLDNAYWGIGESLLLYHC